MHVITKERLGYNLISFKRRGLTALTSPIDDACIQIVSVKLSSFILNLCLKLLFLNKKYRIGKKTIYAILKNKL